MESRELPVEMPMAVEDAAVDLLRHFVQQQPTHRVEAERVLVRAGLGEGQMTEITETERQALNARLARAMGWTMIQSASEWLDLFRWQSPDGKTQRQEPPDFARSAEASRELVGWLAADDERWIEFEQGMLREFGKLRGKGNWAQSFVRWVVTADPLLIAQAADAALHQNQQ